MIDWEFPTEDEWRNIMRAMNDLLAGLPVQAGLAILADVIADGIRPMPPEERARALAFVTRNASEWADMPADEEGPPGWH
jgi:hypothetical protein